MIPSFERTLGRMTAAPRATWEDARLVDACLKGDERAWSAVIAKYKNLIYSIPVKYGATAEDASDIFQSVCLELFHELPRLRNVANLRPWLLTVAAHEALRWKRRQRRRAFHESEPVDEEAAAAIPGPLMADAEREQAVREAIQRLPSRCREMVRMLFYEHPPVAYADVARQLGLAVGSIGFIRARCLKRLQKALEEIGF
jgi:RNA polymerase sigma factor (sigma-70 family)